MRSRDGGNVDGSRTNSKERNMAVDDGLGEELDRLKGLWAQHWPNGRPTAIRYPLGEQPLTAYLAHWASRQPDKPAVVFHGRQWTYGEIDRLSDGFAAAARDAGVVAGDRMALFLPNCPQFIIAFFGILKLGAVHVPISPMSKTQEVEHELVDSGAVAAVVWDQLLETFHTAPSADRLRNIFTVNPGAGATDLHSLPDSFRPANQVEPKHDPFLELARSRSAAFEAPANDLDAVAALNYTGGTTGLPKGCMHTQRGMLYTAAANCSVAMDLHVDDVILCYYSIAWIAGEDISILFPFVSGCTCILLARWDPVALCAAIERHRVTHVSLLVDNLIEVLDDPRTSGFDLTSLNSTRVSSFVKKLDIETRARWKQRTGVTVVEATWGMTETHSCDTFTSGLQEGDGDLRGDPVFVGLPLPGTDIVIRDFDTGLIAAPEAAGEICIRSPSIMKGYWNKDRESAIALRDGWLHSGDIGRIDECGFLRYLGRKKELIKVKGMSVPPAEIEICLQSHAAVMRVGVIARPDEHRGEVPIAFVMLAASISDEEQAAEMLRSWCRERLASYKIPEVRIVSQLPMTASGKVQKHELARLI